MPSSPMLREKFDDINGLQSTLFTPLITSPSCARSISALVKFKRLLIPSVQIHHTGNNHWITSFQINVGGPIYVMDSLCGKGQLTKSTEVQLSSGVGYFTSHGRRVL